MRESGVPDWVARHPFQIVRQIEARVCPRCGDKLKRRACQNLSTSCGYDWNNIYKMAKDDIRLGLITEPTDTLPVVPGSLPVDSEEEGIPMKRERLTDWEVAAIEKAVKDCPDLETESKERLLAKLQLAITITLGLSRGTYPVSRKRI